MRICLIGPSYPFRGGISHHTTLLYRHLRKKHDVNFYAFKRQYPRWLFPGKTDRDTSEIPLRVEGAQQLLDSINPLTWWGVYKKIKKVEPDLVIIPWWSSFWTVQFWTIASLIKRFSAAKLLFICHNIVDHESYSISEICARAVLGKADYLFVHSDSDAKRLRELIPFGRITQAFHPVYDFFQNGACSKTVAKNRMGVQGDVILFFGFIRPYKGLNDLLQAMTEIVKHRRVTLLVVGEFWEGRRAFFDTVDELGLQDAVRVVDRYVPNEEVEVYFSAADLVVLPYRYGTGSGVVQIAYGLEKPVVATRVGSLPMVVEEGKTGHLVNPGDCKALADVVIRFFDDEEESSFVENIRHKKGKFSWESLVALIEARTLGTDAEAE